MSRFLWMMPHVERADPTTDGIPSTILEATPHNLLNKK